MPDLHAGPGYRTLGATHPGNASFTENGSTSDMRGGLKEYFQQLTSGTPLVDLPDNHVAAIRNAADFFGDPTTSAVNAYHQKWSAEKEYEILPEAFGQMFVDSNAMSESGTINKVVLHKVLGSEHLIFLLAPLRRHMGSLTFTVNEMHYNNHRLDREPEEAVPRLLTHKRTAFGARMQRYGIAMQNECTFAETPQGRQDFHLQMEQIRIATIDTIAMGVLSELLTAAPYEDPNDPHRRVNREGATMADVIKMFDDEKDMFGIVHKRRHDNKALRIVEKRLRSVIDQRSVANGDGTGGVGGVMIYPKGISVFLSEAEKGPYFITGNDNSEKVFAAKGRDAIIESLDFSMGDGEPAFDPMVRRVAIGSYNTAHDLMMRGRDPKDYTTGCLTILVYNRDLDGYSTLRYEDHLKYTGIWDLSQPDAPLTDELGRGFVSDLKVYTWLQALKKCRGGDMDPVYKRLMALPEDQWRKVLRSLKLIDKAQFNQRFNVDRGCTFNPDHLEELLMPGWEGFEKQLSFARAKEIKRKREYGAFLDEDDAKMVVEEKKEEEEEKQSPYEAAKAALETIRKNGRDEVPNKAAFRWLGAYIKAMDNVRGLSESDRLSIASELLRVVKAYTSNRSDDVEHVAGVCLAQWVPFVSNVDLRSSIRSVTDSLRTPLEQEAILDNQPLARVYSPQTLVGSGLWRPDGSPEDGQLQLLFKSTPLTYPLPTDAFAATLAATRTVVFTLDDAVRADLIRETLSAGQSTKLHALLKSGLAKQERNDAFLWSVVVSLIVVESPKDKVPAFFKDADISKRLLRHLGKGLKPPLLGQLHLTSHIDAACKYIAGKLGAPVPPSVFLDTVIDIDATGNDVDGAFIKAQTEGFTPTIVKPVPKTLDERVAQYCAEFIRDCNAEFHRDNGALAVTMANATWQTTSDKAARSVTLAAIARILYNDDESKKANASKLATRLGQTLDAFYADKGQKTRTEPVAADAGPQAIRSQESIEEVLSRASITSGAFMVVSLELNIPVAFCIDYHRPNQRFGMGSAMRVGRGAAKTYIRDPDWRMAQDAKSKTIYGHLSLYFKTLLERPELRAMIPNIMCNGGYLGGGGVQPWNPNDRQAMRDFVAGQLTRDMIVWLRPMKDAVRDFPIASITGRFPRSVKVVPQDSNKLEFVGCDVLARFYGIDTDGKNYGPLAEYTNDTDEAVQHNVIEFQGYQRSYNPATGDYTVVIEDRGHWGPDGSRPGASAVFRGNMAQFEHPQQMQSVIGA